MNPTYPTPPPYVYDDPAPSEALDMKSNAVPKENLANKRNKTAESGKESAT